MPTLSVVIPAYNEEKTIVEILNRVKNVDLSHLNVKKEILVISDGSRDQTVSLARKVKGIKVIDKQPNQGKGSAVRRGIKESTGDIIIIQDADLEYDPNDYAKVIAPILENRAKVVYGSRFLGSKEKHSIFSRKHKNAYPLAYIGAQVVTSTANLLFGLNITDEATCYKCFKSEVIKSIQIEGNKFEWEPEVTAKIARKGIKIQEVPISYSPRSFEQGKKINWKDGVHAIYTLFKYRLK